jgi:hypothetical protein
VISMCRYDRSNVGWHRFWHPVGVKVYRRDVAQGSIEPLRTGFRARVFAGRDPITGRKQYLRGETRRVRRDAEADRDRLLAQVEADQHRTNMRR